MNHLDFEVREYRDTAISRAEEFNWNELDKKEIRLKVLEIFKRRMVGRYGDVKFSMNDVGRILDEVMGEVFG